MVSRKEKDNFEEIAIIAIAVVLVLGLVLVFGGLQGIIFNDRHENEKIKDQIIQNLEKADQKLNELGKTLTSEAG